MPRTLAAEILSVLDEPRATNGPLTISHLSRRLGVSAALTRLCAKQLIADGSANAFMVHQNGADTIQGLSRVVAPEATPPKEPAESAADDTSEELLRRADQALYSAKRSGRNRVVADAA